MDDLPRRELRSLIAGRGVGACLDPRRFEDELVGMCGDFEKEVFVLVAALKKDVVSELLRASDTSPIQERVARIAGRLCDIGLERQAAGWAAETWAIALGLIQAEGQPSMPDEPTAPGPIEYECPHCHAAEEADGPGRVVPVQERKAEGSPHRIILKERMDGLEAVAADESLDYDMRISALDRTHSEIRKENVIR